MTDPLVLAFLGWVIKDAAGPYVVGEALERVRKQPGWSKSVARQVVRDVPDCAYRWRTVRNWLETPGVWVGLAVLDEEAIERLARNLSDRVRQTPAASQQAPGIVVLAASEILTVDTSVAAQGLRAALQDLQQVKGGQAQILREVRGPFGDPAEAEAEIAERSGLTLDDASRVCSVAVGTYTEEIRLGDLYVSRPTVERAVLDCLDGSLTGSGSGACLLVGEAGHGKTSFLWQTQRKLDTEGHHAWFLRAADLDTILSGGATVATVLLTAARGVRERGERSTVLIDTVDTLLHQDQDRDLLRRVIGGLAAEGAAIVAACRPFEAIHMPEGLTKVALGTYESDELSEAVKSHVRAFYLLRGDVTSDLDVFASKILRAAHLGTSIGPVCARPLTLRMLFEVYAPDEVPEEVNTHQLYRAYWSARVASDRRAGSLPGDHQDCSAAATATALAMVAEGRPFLPDQALESHRGLAGVTDLDVTELRNRGVLNQDTSQLEFFHQTFFEHAAARALVQPHGKRGLDAVAERLARRPHDAHLWPILEQSLLLAEDADASCRGRADEIESELINSAHALAIETALSVFCQRRAVLESHRVAVTALAQQSQDLLRLYLRSSANLPTHRFAEHAALMEAAWSRAGWASKADLLDELPRLAWLAPDLAKALIDRAEIPDFAISKGGFEVGAPSRFLPAVVTLHASHPEWAALTIRSVVEGVAAQSPTASPSARVLRAAATEISERSDHSSIDWLALALPSRALQDPAKAIAQGIDVLVATWKRDGLPDARILIQEMSSDGDGEVRSSAFAGAAANWVRENPSEAPKLAMPDLFNLAPRGRWRAKDLLVALVQADETAADWIYERLGLLLAVGSPDDRMRLAATVIAESGLVGDHRKSRFRISESRGPGVRVSLGG